MSNREKVAQAWPGVHAVSVEEFNADPANTKAGEPFRTIIKLDANGLGHDLGVECVIYKIEDGQEKYEGREEFKMVGEEGNICTFELKTKLREAGTFRYAYRVYPKNAELPHRQDFAYVLWV